MASPLQYASPQEFLNQENANGAFSAFQIPALDQALQWASRLAAAYIRKRKVMPLLEWGGDLKHAVCRLAKYELLGARGYAPNSAGNSVIRDQYDDAISWLKDVAQGNAELEECVDSTTTPGIDEAGPLMASDTIVNWNYQTRPRCWPPRGDGLG